jgi:hypothetical protein
MRRGMQGTVSREKRCATCLGNQHECPGHFGHIRLTKPVYNVAYMDKIVRVLNSVCYHCSKVRLLLPSAKARGLLAYRTLFFLSCSNYVLHLRCVAFAPSFGSGCATSRRQDKR